MSERTLIAFTLLSQGSIGLFWITVISRLSFPEEIISYYIQAIAISLGLSVTGSLVALGHLSKPFRAQIAFSNFKHSWLSREVAFLVGFTVGIFLSLIFAWLNVWNWTIYFDLVVCFIGFLALLAMTKVYLIKTVPVWNSPVTILEFFGSAFVLGGVSTIWVFPEHMQTSFTLNTPATIMSTALFLGVVLKLLALQLKYGFCQAGNCNYWRGMCEAGRSIQLVAGIRLMLYFSSLFGLYWNRSFLIVFSLIIAEIIGRWYFYRSYSRIGV